MRVARRMWWLGVDLVFFFGCVVNMAGLHLFRWATVALGRGRR